MKKLLLFVLVSFVLVGLFAFADNTGDSHKTGDRQEGMRGGSQFTGLSASAIACVTTAVTTRDATIKAGMAAYAATWMTTFDARTAAFIAALSLTNKKEMKKAMDLAWKTSNTSIKAVQKTKKGVIQEAWNMYKTNLKACNTDISKVLMQEKGGNDLNN